MKSNLIYLGAKISKQLNEKITEAINRGDYVSKSELVRAALKALLNEKGGE